MQFRVATSFTPPLPPLFVSPPALLQAAPQDHGQHASGDVVRGAARGHRVRAVDGHAGGEQRRVRLHHPHGGDLHDHRLRRADGAAPAPHERQDTGVV